MEIGDVDDEAAALVVDEGFDLVHVYALSHLIQFNGKSTNQLIVAETEQRQNKIGDKREMK